MTDTPETIRTPKRVYSRKGDMIFHLQTSTCPHENEHACAFCDFDHFYADTYPDCPWAESETP